MPHGTLCGWGKPGCPSVDSVGKAPAQGLVPCEVEIIKGVFDDWNSTWLKPLAWKPTRQYGTIGLTSNRVLATPPQ